MRYIFYTLLAILAFPPALLAEHSDDVATSVVREGTRAAFEELEKQLIYKYFGEHAYYHDREYDKSKSRDKNYKKGKDKALPPGIKQKLERGGTMPPGIAKRYLPDDLSHRLPPAPRGYERTIVGNDVLLVEMDTGKIADILVYAVLGN